MQPARFEVRPDHPIAKALLTDERMENLWIRIGNWPGSLGLVQMAVHYSDPDLLAKLMTAPQERTAFGYVPSLLSDMAADFAIVLESFSSTASELWGEAIAPLVERLRAFAEAGSRQASKAKAFYDFVPKPSFRGKGDRHQRAFRDAMTYVVKKLIALYGRPLSQHGRPLSQEEEDIIIATLASVLFPASEIDAGSVKRHRERQKSKQRAGDKKACCSSSRA